jgi:hypothetical protein
MYYVPKKNRCSCLLLGINVGPCSYKTIPAKKCSIYSKYKSSSTVYSSEKRESIEKGVGNIKKHGSGGNSYSAYLSNKIGKTRHGYGYKSNNQVCGC